ncbi:MAG TPA: hypothetical protein VMD56_00290, partial [Steroidobacteraceae bacterium]|nr:hypothetical protein [Steroidobacteraceae bacterium]
MLPAPDLRGLAPPPNPLADTEVPADAPPRPAAPFLPTTREEMQALGWSECDAIIVSGDAYVDHPSFGMAIIGRVL